MMIRALPTWLVLLLTVIVSTATAQRAAAEVTVWRPHEISLTAQKSYANPYKDVQLSAEFIGPNGEQMIMPGFWDGGNIWRIRFAPPSAGEWRYKTIASNMDDVGLQGKSGRFTAAAYAGKLDIYRRGFLKVSANHRYLTYGDGTPFYWLGDTNWGGFSSAIPWTGPDGEQVFKAIADRRVAQGFSVWKAETFANNVDDENPAINEGGKAWLSERSFDQPNPGFWQDVDRRVRYVADTGLVLSIAQGVGRSLKSAAQTEDHRRLALYILARYGAFPTVWITAQEYNLSYSGQTVCADCWADIARSVWEADPYKRPNSLHSWIDNPIRFHDQPWYNFVTLQEGHGAPHAVDYWFAQYQATPPRPILEDEANYELIIPKYSGFKEEWTRHSAWMSQIGGAFGFTYGAQGIWYGCVRKVDPNPNCGAGKDGFTWREALEFPIGNRQLGYMREFWTELPWWQLRPDRNAIEWRDAPAGTQRPFQKVSPGNRIIVAYLPVSERPYGGILAGAGHDAVIRARWFDPRTGQYTATTFNNTADGWSIPPKPTSEDWVLLIERAD